MTYEELKIEANKMDYNLIKKKEYVPHKRCKCGKRGLYCLANRGDGKVVYFIECKECKIHTSDHKSEDDAWKEWNNMQEE